MHKVKGILFDKDGTLIDFYGVWLQAAEEAIPKLLEIQGLVPSREMVVEILETIGVVEGVVDPNGALAYKSYAEIAEDIADTLSKKGVEIVGSELLSTLKLVFNTSVAGINMKDHEFIDTRMLFQSLKEQGYIIGLATADTEESAIGCLEDLEVMDLIDFIGADDGVRNPKPAPDMFLEFAQKYQLKADEIMMIGDTYNDIRFGRENGGIAVGVLSGVSKEEHYKGQADYIIDTVEQLKKWIEKR